MGILDHLAWSVIWTLQIPKQRLTVLVSILQPMRLASIRRPTSWMCEQPAIMSLQDDADNTGLLKRRRHLLDSNDEEEYDVADDEDEDEGDSDEDEDMEEDEHKLEAGKDSERDSQAEEVAETAETTVEEGSMLNRRGADSLAGVEVAQTGIDSDAADLDEDYKEGERLEKHKKKHKKHKHKKHKHKKKKHKKDRQQCRYLEGLTRSIVKFGTSSGDYLSVSHGNNTCYQAVRHLVSRVLIQLGLALCTGLTPWWCLSLPD